MNLSRTKLTVIILLTAVAVVFVIKGMLSQSPAELTALNPKTKGSPSADIKIVEFFDFQCPSCAKASFLISDYMKKFPGKLYVQAKYYPLGGHLHSMTAAKYAECSRQQGKFWQMHDLLMSQQQDWRNKDVVVGDFNAMAREIGLDMRQLDQCYSDPATEDIIIRDKREGQSFQIRSTPSFFVNGKFVSGRSSFTALMEEMLGPIEQPEEPAV